MLRSVNYSTRWTRPAAGALAFAVLVSLVTLLAPSPAAADLYVARVNFQKELNIIPVGYQADIGDAYSESRGYGWVAQDSGAPLSIVGQGRNRNTNSTDERLDTLVHMQTPVAARWELKVNPGEYEVAVTVGDAGPYFDSTHRLSVEGTLAVDNFVSTAETRHRSRTLVVNVTDGRLTLDAAGGTNTKINFIDVRSLAPQFTSVTPANGAGNVPTNTSVALLTNVPVDSATVNSSNVRLLAPNGSTLPGNYSVDAVGGTVTFTPAQTLLPLTQYRISTTGVKAKDDGKAFDAFNSSFTTGEAERVDTTVSFTKEMFDDLPGVTSMTIGPDGKLYAATGTGSILRYRLAANGLPIGEPENIENAWTFERTITGIVFDPSSTATNLKLWVSHGYLGFEDVPNFTGSISLLTGANLQTKRDVITGLPRSSGDHLNNGIAFGPDGRLYILVGSLNGYGAPDAYWAFREETPLSAAVLVADVNRNTAFNGTVNVATGEGGTYNPDSVNAPVKTHATGTRNPFDLLWHTNGKLYVPVNESSDGNTPGGPGNDPPALSNVRNYPDFLASIKAGKYYGHPNPSRGEYVLNGGNPTNGADLAETSEYPVGIQPDADWDPPIHSFGLHRSTNGIAEFKSDVFGSAYRGMLLTTQFAFGDDVQGLLLDAAGNVSGVAQVASGFNNPLDVITVPGSGITYVSEYGSQPSGNGGKITLLRPKATAAPGEFDLEFTHQGELGNGPRLVFSAADAEAECCRYIVVKNRSTQNPLRIDGFSFSGPDASSFKLKEDQSTTFTLAPGEGRFVGFQFDPPGSWAKWEHYATLTVNTNDVDEPATNVALAGLHTPGFEGTNEGAVAKIVRVLGYSTNIGGENLTLSKSNLPIGDEIISPYWKRVDASKPVKLLPIARYEGRLDAPITGPMGWYPKPPDAQTARPSSTTFVHFPGGPRDGHGGENQKLLPQPNKAVASSSFNPTGPFGLGGSASFSDSRFNNTPRRTHDFRFWPAKNPSGAVIPNTWIVAIDPGDGPGKNWDYNDSMFVMYNAKPEIDTATTPLPYLQEFQQVVASWIIDKDGQGTPFQSVQANKNNNSYDRTKIDLIPGASRLNIRSAPGTMAGSTNTAKNALQVAFDATRQLKPKVSTRVLGSPSILDENGERYSVYFGPDSTLR